MPIDIKGKNYTTVNERVLQFIATYKDWSINTELVEITPDTVVMKALIRDSSGTVRATGYAQEDRKSSMINRTSYAEVCETSAVGRALGFLGIGIQDSISTADEVQHAQKVQTALEAEEDMKKNASATQKKRKITKDEADDLECWIINTQTDPDKLLSYYKVKRTVDLTYEQYQNAMEMLKKKNESK